MGVRSTGNQHPTTTQADGHLLEYFRQTFGAGGGGTNAPPGLGGLTATGGVISDYTTSPGDIYRAHVFTTSGTFNVSALGGFGSDIDYLVVAGGGGGGKEGGGGGAGGVRSSHPDMPSPAKGTALTVSATNYTVTIGAGGAGADGEAGPVNDGNPSHFGPGSPIPINTSGGGGGGSKRYTNGNEIPEGNRYGRAGGSSGGAGRDANSNSGVQPANSPPFPGQLGNVGGN